MEKASVAFIIAAMVLCLRMCAGTEPSVVPENPSVETSASTATTESSPSDGSFDNETEIGG